MGLSCAGLQNWAEAERCFGRAAALAPSFSFAAANRTLALYQLGRTEEAIRWGPGRWFHLQKSLCPVHGAMILHMWWPAYCEGAYAVHLVQSVITVFRVYDTIKDLSRNKQHPGVVAAPDISKAGDYVGCVFALACPAVLS